MVLIERGLIMGEITRPIFTLPLAVFFIRMSAVPARAATYTPRTINYMALGDSVAAGVMLPYYPEKSDFAYTDDIAIMLKNAGFNVNFDKSFCKAGATAAGLATITEGFKTLGTGPYNLIHNANIVTLDIGANDFLGGFYAAVNSIKDIQYPTDIEVAGVIDSLNAAINGLYYGSTGKDVQKNIETILQNILTANPKAKIYVMGYYNPLPGLSVYGMDLTVPVMYFNTFIYKAICNVRTKTGASISYVDTLLPMSGGVEKGYLSPTDIHPTETGYQVIANEFWKRIKLNFVVS